MPLSGQTRNAIRTYLQQVVETYIQEGLENPAAMESKPFHARLMPTLFGVPLSERSFSTRLGSWFQNIARLVALQFNQDAQNNYRVTGQIQPAAETHIGAIVSQMETPPPNRRIPNRQLDTQQVLAVQSPGGVAKQVISDLYILTHDDRELYFEMKTVAPNKDTSKLMKTKILLISALRQGHNADAYAAMAYNPAGEGQSYTEYADSRYAVQFLELGTDLIVGRPFWEMIGDNQTYDELLQIAEEVGTTAAALIPKP
ncbi:MAG: TdeIII family type II restriction endonuclease [Terriglobales bacterium]